MIEIPVKQGSPEWRALRVRRVTGSDIHGVVKRWQSTMRAHLLEALGQDGFAGNIYTRFGHEQEPAARDAVEVRYGPVRQVGILIDGRFAASPDGLLDSLALEIKSIYSGMLPHGPKPMHRAQLNWVMGLAGKEAGLLVYWNPITPMEVFEIEFDPSLYEQQQESARKFLAVADRILDNENPLLYVGHKYRQPGGRYGATSQAS